jgi:hypothetical protein
MNMKVGDWVISKGMLPNGKKVSAVSIIVEIKDNGLLMTVGVKKYQGIGFILSKQFVKPMKVSLEDEDIKAMIDLALAMGDKKWFDELTAKLSTSKPKGGLWDIGRR